jgi:signal transduction histidine kinase/CheY-like chemotaxis protein
MGRGLTHPLLSTEVCAEQDLVVARQRARQIASLLGLDLQDQTRVATAVSEIARNAFQYAGSGRVTFELDDTAEDPLLLVEISDQGPGIEDTEAVLHGAFQSTTGAGIGIQSARRLMDGFQITSALGAGVQVRMHKRVRAPFVTAEQRATIAGHLASHRPESPLAEVHQQNQELAHALDELRKSQRDLALLNRELEETNRGVMVLYNELEEKAEALRRSTASKSRFFSEMNHEVRTPINSILKLSELLLNGTFAEPLPEQQTALGYIRRSAQQLSELVDDLLDLAKSEAGKLVVRPSSFTVEELFAGLRGMFRPLHTREEVKLSFDASNAALPLHTDEGKVAQIMRNFISNALKFTERGQVTVSVTMSGDEVVFAVSDTGIGIDPAQHRALFEPFSQIDNPRQRMVKGTGLGLSLTRVLTELLGGHVSVESVLGEGSTFRAFIPRVFLDKNKLRDVRVAESELASPRIDVLIVDNDEVTRFLLRGTLRQPHRHVLEAGSGEEGLRLAREHKPKIVFLDLQMPNMDGFAVLEALRYDQETASIPVVVHTALALSAEQSAWLAERTLSVLSKERASHEQTAAEIKRLLAQVGVAVTKS